MKAGDRLSNGAILLAETIYQQSGEEDEFQRSIVLAMNPGAVEPFVTWHRMSINGSTIHDTTAYGHYFRSIAGAFKEFEERSEGHTHAEANKKAIIERATDDAKAAASWWEDGDMSYEKTRRWFEALDEDVDPEYEDQLPVPRLGGEFADDPSWEQIFRDECELTVEQRQSVQTHPQYDDLYELYCYTFNEVVREEIVNWLAKRLEAFDLEDAND